MTRRTLLIASFSLAKEHSISFERKVADDIFSDEASCLSDGSKPNLSFNLKFIYFKNILERKLRITSDHIGLLMRLFVVDVVMLNEYIKNKKKTLLVIKVECQITYIFL